MNNKTAQGVDRLRQSVRLPDGRTLAYAEYGVAGGKPVLYFHGLSGSRLEPGILEDADLERAGLRLIACDRPGIGGSDFQPGRGFSDWVTDMVCFADMLGLHKFGVWGVSGGGGYAAACARLIPDRLTAAVIVSGAGHMDSPEAMAALSPLARFLWWLAGRSVPLTALFLKLLTMGVRGDPAKIRQQTLSRMAPVERAFFEKPGRLEAFLASGLESIRPGIRGLAWDTHLYACPWDFRLEEIRFPVRLLHGEADINVPVVVARQVAAAIPGCQATFYPGEEHLSILVNHLDEVYQTLGEG